MFLAKHFLGVKPDETEDIQRNLGFVLSAKRGCGYFVPSFGLSEMTFRTPEEAVTKLTEEIKQNISLFEPRVELVKVDEVYDDDGQQVRLVAVLRPRASDTVLRLVVDLQDKSFSFEAPPSKA
jgi:phage baseplate assembly protein W